MIDDIDIRCDPGDPAGLLREIRRRDKIIHALMNQVQRNLNSPDNDFSLLQTTFMLEEEVKHRTQEMERAVDALAVAKEELQKAYSELEERVAERTAELSQQVHFLQQLIEAIPGPVFYKDAQLRYLGCNSAFEAFIGVPASELVGKTPHDISAKEYADTFVGADRKLLENPGSQIYECQVRYANGELRDVMFHKATFTQRDGTIGGLIGLMLDITERKRAEASLRESRQLLQDIIDNSTALIYVKDMQGRFLLVNRRFEEQLRDTSCNGLRSTESILGKTDHEVFPREQAEAYRELDQQVLDAGAVSQTEDTRMCADGLHTFIATRVPLRDDQGRPYATCGVLTDITERKRLEEQLREAQKMEAMGKLAGGIAHDFNNLMTVITGYGEMLRSALEDSPLRDKAEQILRAGEQATSLTQQLLAFTRQQILQPRLLDLRTVLSDMGKMLRRVVSEDIELTVATDPEPCLIRADRGQIQQVIMNLLINARDATSRGGKITLAVENVWPEDDLVRRHIGDELGSCVRLTVSDTGHGMDAETQARIFEPFFTTKEQGKGTGLGLATVYGIVQQTGGYVAVESEPGRGATFSVYFPAATGAPSEEERPPSSAELVPGSETILVVEDQEGLRTLTCEILRRNGYTVIPAANGCEALVLAAEHSGRIDLMITDLVMPKMGGREVAESLPASHPETKVLFMSGYVDDINELLSRPGNAFIDKPFSSNSLLRKVREVLDRAVEKRQCA